MSFVSELNQEIVDEITEILGEIFGFRRKLPLIREIPLFPRFIELTYEKTADIREVNVFAYPTLDSIIEVLVAEGLSPKVEDKVDFLVRMIRLGLYFLATGKTEKLGSLQNFTREEIVCQLIRRFYGDYNVPKRFANEFPKIVRIAQWV